jgi:hypothetical protein
MKLNGNTSMIPTLRSALNLVVPKWPEGGCP